MGNEIHTRPFIHRFTRAMWVAFGRPLLDRAMSVWDRVPLVLLRLIEALGWLLILNTVGDCNLQQATVLGIAIATVSPRSHRRKTKQCHPYRVRISPRWNRLLLDFRLIGDDGEWVAIQETLKPKSSAEHFALRDGMQFTVLRQSAEFERMVRGYPNVYPHYRHFMHLQEEQPGLIFSRSIPTFRAYSQFEETLDPIRFFDGVNEREPSVESWIDASNAIDSSGYLSVNLFMDYCPSGYSLGISVSAYWWERVKNRCAVPLSVQHVGHYVRLVLAIIS
jgi:hypothetical protein